MKSGMLAAEATFAALQKAASPTQLLDLSSYEQAIKDSSIMEELYSSRNIRPG